MAVHESMADSCAGFSFRTDSDTRDISAKGPNAIPAVLEKNQWDHTWQKKNKKRSSHRKSTWNEVRNPFCCQNVLLSETRYSERKKDRIWFNSWDREEWAFYISMVSVCMCFCIHLLIYLCGTTCTGCKFRLEVFI